ncbi:hypothetical protein HaLaN_24802 [Haematococcus lacustris]|uniref:Secreted protein n=1 Tax=Haematococcus lacustris TaxID=44745 RepID=A0A699ZX90_HAELA|nr:hypothetical protein HaLaN_24802 [Haematococcus lacustris]
MGYEGSSLNIHVLLPVVVCPLLVSDMHAPWSECPLGVPSPFGRSALWRCESPSTPPGKQREERRAVWKTQRRQVRTGALTALSSKSRVAPCCAGARRRSASYWHISS